VRPLLLVFSGEPNKGTEILRGYLERIHDLEAQNKSLRSIAGQSVAGCVEERAEVSRLLFPCGSK
jgi:hypothetical protein